MSFPSYPAYKDSGVEWIGSVPIHWAVQPLKRHARLLTEKTDRRTHPVALENIEGWTGRFVPTETEFEGEGVAFEPGDVLFGKLRPYLAKTLVTESLGEAVGDFLVIRPAVAARPRFLGYQLRSREVISIIDGSTFGSKMPRASWDFVGMMQMTLPPANEQTAIATFLDRETAKIDALVEEQKRLIELLKEKRQAVISQAVTKGLDPNVPMKDSGVAWLGKVPAHWQVSAVRRVIDRIEQGWSPECESWPADDDSWGVLKAGCVNRGVFDPAENKTLPEGLAPVPEYEVQPGDVLVSRASGSPELVGSTALVGAVRAKLMISDKIFRVHLADEMTPAFFVWAMNSRSLREQIEQALSGGNGLANNLPQSALKAFVMAIPPRDEQVAIASSMGHESSNIEALIAESQHALTLLQERRSALISAAVTGKIDVRGLGHRTDGDELPSRHDESHDLQCERSNAGAHHVAHHRQ